MTLLSLQGDAALFFFIKVTFTHKYEWDRTDVECQTFFFLSREGELDKQLQEVL